LVLTLELFRVCPQPESFLAFLKEHASTPFSVELPSSAKDDL
jgi:hypothetical protein